MNSALQVEFAVIVGRRNLFDAGMSGSIRQFDKDIAKGLIGSGIALVADPEAFLNKLKVFFLNATKDHGTHLSVTDGQSFLLPARGGLGVLKGQGLRTQTGPGQIKRAEENGCQC